MVAPMHESALQSSRGDVELLARIAAGDERALEELYGSLGSLAYSLAMTLLRDAADAEEAVSDAFAQVWRSAREFNVERGSLRAWVTTLVRSRAIDRLRARRRGERLAREAEAGRHHHEHLGLPSVATAEHATETAEQSQQVATALATLTPSQQEVLRLAYFSGFSQSEIAKRLKQPLGTVKTRLRTSLSKLRQMLAPIRERGEL